QVRLLSQPNLRLPAQPSSPMAGISIPRYVVSWPFSSPHAPIIATNGTFHEIGIRRQAARGKKCRRHGFGLSRGSEPGVPLEQLLRRKAHSHASHAHFALDSGLTRARTRSKLTIIQGERMAKTKF